MPTPGVINYTTPQDDKYVRSLLKGINSIGHFKKDIVTRLINEPIDELVIDKFTVSPAEYEGWAYAMRELCESFYYDQRRQHIIIKGRISEILSVIERWIWGPVFDAVLETQGKLGIDQLKVDKYKSPPVLLMYQPNYPDADYRINDIANQKVLNGEAHLVVGVVFDPARPKSATVKPAERRVWDLKPLELAHMTEEELAEHVTDWHLRNDVSVTEKLRFSVYFWSNRRKAQEVLLDHPLVPTNAVENDNCILSIPEPTLTLAELVDVDTDNPTQYREVVFPLRQFVSKLPAQVDLIALQHWARNKAETMKKTLNWLGRSASPN